MPYIVLYFTAFLELWLLNYLWKMRGYQCSPYQAVTGKIYHL